MIGLRALSLLLLLVLPHVASAASGLVHACQGVVRAGSDCCCARPFTPPLPATQHVASGEACCKASAVQPSEIAASVVAGEQRRLLERAAPPPAATLLARPVPDLLFLATRASTTGVAPPSTAPPLYLLLNAYLV